MRGLPNVAIWTGSPANRSIENTNSVIPKKTGMRYRDLLRMYFRSDNRPSP